MTYCINLFGGPGIGKTRVASLLLAEMKIRHLDVEMAPEVAKDYLWQNREYMLKDNQISVFGAQWERIHKFLNRVDFVVCDGPVLLGSVYAPPAYPQAFHDLLLWTHQQVPSINFLLARHQSPFTQSGRRQTGEESLQIDHRMRAMLDQFHVPYTVLSTENPVRDAVEVLHQAGLLKAT